MGESPLPKSKSGTKLSLLSTFESVGNQAYGFLGNTTSIRIYGRNHGLDHDSVHQRNLMVLRLAGWNGHQLGHGYCFLCCCALRLDVCSVRDYSALLPVESADVLRFHQLLELARPVSLLRLVNRALESAWRDTVLLRLFLLCN